MKIFISYSRRDAGDFANQIHRHLSTFKHDIFTDVDTIRVGEVWSNTIEENISNCDIFVVIVTDGALHSPYVENEVLQAQKENKKIIPCFHKNVREDDIKWGLERIQGIEFTNEFQLARELYSKINVGYNSNEVFSDISKLISNTVDTPSYSNKKTVDNVKTPTVLTKSSDVIIHQQKSLPQPPKEERTVVADKLLAPKHTIKKYSFLKLWGREGKGDGEFRAPSSIAVDSSEYVYVSDTNNNRIQKFDSNGKFIIKFGKIKYKYLGYRFSEKDEVMALPYGIAVDSSSGYVYVTGSLNNRIQKFDSDGNFIAKWGSYVPIDIAVDSSEGYVYVTQDHNIIKFDSDGNFIAKWGKKGKAEGEFKSPNGIYVDSEGNVYVADRNNHRIQKFDNNGNFITKWGREGKAEGEFKYPEGIYVDSEGNVYVADTRNHRIQKFDSNGNFITKWGREGKTEGEFNEPSSIAVDSSKGYVYVADRNNHRIQVFALAELSFKE